MIELSDRVILSSVMFYLNKIETSFSEEELSSIKEIHIKNQINKPEELKYLKGLVNILFEDIEINKELIDAINELDKVVLVSFEKCVFKYKPELKKIKILSISECVLDDLSFLSKLNNLDGLCLEFMNVDNLDFMNNLNRLSYLSLTGSNINSKIRLEKTNIDELHIDGVNIKDINDIFFPEKLKVIYISKIQYLYFTELFNDLKNYGIEVNFGIDAELVK